MGKVTELISRREESFNGSNGEVLKWEVKTLPPHGPVQAVSAAQVKTRARLRREDATANPYVTKRYTDPDKLDVNTWRVEIFAFEHPSKYYFDRTENTKESLKSFVSPGGDK